MLRKFLKPIDIFLFWFLLDKVMDNRSEDKQAFPNTLDYMSEGKLLLTDIVEKVKRIFYVQYSFPLRLVVFEKIKQKRKNVGRLLHYE
jgi:hypothetical protein